MKELLNQDRAMSIGLAKFAVNVIGVAFAITSLAIILLGVHTLFSMNLLPALIQIFGGPALLLSIYMILRLLIEILMATHRGNDRLGVMVDITRDKRQSTKDAE